MGFGPALEQHQRWQGLNPMLGSNLGIFCQCQFLTILICPLSWLLDLREDARHHLAGTRHQGRVKDRLKRVVLTRSNIVKAAKLLFGCHKQESPRTWFTS